MLCYRLSVLAFHPILLAATAAVLTSGCLLPSTPAQDTVIQLTELSNALALARVQNQGLGARLGGTPVVTGDAETPAVMAVMPARVDLRPACPPVYHQGPFRTCTGFAVAKGLGEFLLRKRGDKTPLSAIHLYTQTFNAESVAQMRKQPGADALKWEIAITDTGALIAASMATLEMGGAVAEADSPYPPSSLWPTYWNTGLVPGPLGKIDNQATDVLRSFFKFSTAVFSAGDVSYDGLKTRLRIKAAKRVDSLAAIRASLTAGMPVVAGFQTFESFYSDAVRRTGRVPLPAPGERSLDGHAMLIVGYNDGDRTLIVRNSWGEAWGDKGYAYMAYEAFARKQIRDAWTVGEL